MEGPPDRLAQEGTGLAPRDLVGARPLAWLAVGLLLAILPFATALVAVGYAPPAQVEIAGQEVRVRPVIGQDTSRLFNGALVSPAHKRLAGKDIGVDVDADWNRLVPSNESTRRYLVSLWENPQPAIHRIEAAAARQVLIWAVGGFLVGLTVVAAVLGLTWQRRRRLAGYSQDESRFVATHNRRLRLTLVVTGVVAVLVLDSLAARVWLHEERGTLTASPVLRGTPLEGMQVTGLLADVLPFLSVLRPRSEFYDEVSDNLRAALAGRSDIRDGEDEVVFVVAEDFESVNGMARQVGLTAQLLDADFIALSGDLTFAGNPLETYLLDTVDYYSEDLPVLFAPGLHDTAAIVEAAESRDWHIAEGSTQDVEGLRMLAFGDPRISTIGTFGTGAVLRDPDVDVDAFVAAAVDRTCSDLPDFVLLHDHLLGRRIAESGCAQFAVLDGRSFDFIGPQPVETDTGGTSTEFTLGSAGGHADTQPNPGIIQHPARFAVIVADSDTHAAEYAVVTVQPDATVSVTPLADITTPFRPR